MNPSHFACTNNLFRKIKSDYPNLIFKIGKKFTFRPPKTIIIEPQNPNFDLLLLHELGHATLKHQSFKTDIERLKIESAAWEQAEQLAKTFNIAFDNDFAQNQLDSYRNWLHQKSRCKKCGLTRFQTPDGKYHCPNCNN